MMFFSPLEQFQILPVIPIRLFFDFSITNGTIIFFLSFVLFCIFLALAMPPSTRSFMSLSKIYELLSLPNQTKTTFSVYLLPLYNINHIIFEALYLTVRDLVRDNIGSAGARYFPYILSLFLFILISNVVGLVPYSFTITSHLILTFAFALSSFIAINIIGIQKHGLNMLSLFLPPGSSMALALLLVPIEFVSYVFRPISLAVRLFANMMAGHTLLKVIAGFAWVMTTLGTGLWLAHFIPLLILTLLMGLELAVAIIQAYVFTILICIYLNDALHLH